MWMNKNRLKLNYKKTEQFLIFGSVSGLKKKMKQSLFG